MKIFTFLIEIPNYIHSIPDCAPKFVAIFHNVFHVNQRLLEYLQQFRTKGQVVTSRIVQKWATGSHFVNNLPEAFVKMVLGTFILVQFILLSAD
jgi:hypothetical protein